MAGSAPAAVEATLARYAGIVESAMGDVLCEGKPAAYLSDLVHEYPSRRSKGIRPALVLAACQAYGGSLREGLGPAVSIELLHNAFLIHDDIEDGSARRRGAPSLHELHGAPLAVNAGDALAVTALLPLRDWGVLGARVSRRLSDELLAMVRQTTEGQALELGWRRNNVVDLGAADYMTLIAKKTCCYTTVAPLRLGALAGSRGTASLAALTRFGFFLGAAFQIRDDLLSVVGHVDGCCSATASSAPGASGPGRTRPSPNAKPGLGGLRWPRTARPRGFGSLTFGSIVGLFAGLSSCPPGNWLGFDRVSRSCSCRQGFLPDRRRQNQRPWRGPRQTRAR